MKTVNALDSFLYFCECMSFHRFISILLLFILIARGGPVIAQEGQVVVPYTLADRDRIIQIEGRLTALESKVDMKFDNQQRQLDDLKAMLFWGFGIMMSLMLFMMGYMVWDRRTAMKPAVQQSATNPFTSLVHGLKPVAIQEDGIF